MKDYIVKVEESYFDTAKFEVGGFYLVTYKSPFEDVDKETHKCILTSATKDKLTFKYYDNKGCNHDIIILPFEIESGKNEIKEVKTRDEPLSDYKDLFYNKHQIKTGRSYVIKIDDIEKDCEFEYNGFCSYRNKDVITMVVYSSLSSIACITHDPTIYGKWSDNITSIKFPGDPTIIHNSMTFGTIMKINLNEICENYVFFKELR